MTAKTGFGLSILFIAMALIVASCDNRLDKDGGYFDEKTQTYRYVRPRITDNDARILNPRDGQRQSITGKVVKVDDNAKAIWLRIEDRKPYQTLASALSTQNRDDKNKDIRIYLSNVSPPGSVVQSVKLRTQWKEYVSRVLVNELVDQNIVVEATYSEKTRRFTGTAYTTQKTKKGRVIRDLNLWMIQQGLSFYFVDQGLPPDDQAYKDAQKFAMKKKLGLWQYQ